MSGYISGKMDVLEETSAARVDLGLLDFLVRF